MFGISEGVSTVVGTSFLFFTLGHNSIWGTMVIYYLSYLRLNGEPNLTTASLNIMPTLLILS